MRRVTIGALVGALAGYLYYYFIGCRSGSCAITGNPFISTIYFSVIGLLLGFVLKKSNKPVKKEVEEAS